MSRKKGKRPLKAVPLQQTLSRFLFGTETVLAIEDTGVEPWLSDPARQSNPWKSYLGAGFNVNGVPHGTLVFFSAEPRRETWTETDKDFLRLMGALVAAAVERGLQYHKLDQMAFYDPLTDLPNRILLNDRLAHGLSVAKRQNHAMALLCLDLDAFKPVKDTLGHAAGDSVLHEVAERLRKVVREVDTVARIGGDEFVVLQSFIHKQSDAELLASRILDAIRPPFEIDGQNVHIGMSIGVALYPQDAEDVPNLFKRADTALYDAKHKGKDQISFYKSATMYRT